MSIRRKNMPTLNFGKWNASPPLIRMGNGEIFDLMEDVGSQSVVRPMVGGKFEPFGGGEILLAGRTKYFLLTKLATEQLAAIAGLGSIPSSPQETASELTRALAGREWYFLSYQDDTVRTIRSASVENKYRHLGMVKRWFRNALSSSNLRWWGCANNDYEFDGVVRMAITPDGSPESRSSGMLYRAAIVELSDMPPYFKGTPAFFCGKSIWTIDEPDMSGVIPMSEESTEILGERLKKLYNLPVPDELSPTAYIPPEVMEGELISLGFPEGFVNQVQHCKEMGGYSLFRVCTYVPPNIISIPERIEFSKLGRRLLLNLGG
jgi:hypothetical protein